MTATIRCPSCANPSEPDAIKCGFCGRLLISANVQRIIYMVREMPESERTEYLGTLTDPQRRALEAADAVLPALPWRGGRDCIICPNANCGFQGPAETRDKANVGLGCLLSIFFIVPGIIYFMIMAGSDYFCPNCGLQIRTTH